MPDRRTFARWGYRTPTDRWAHFNYSQVGFLLPRWGNDRLTRSAASGPPPQSRGRRGAPAPSPPTLLPLVAPPPRRAGARESGVRPVGRAFLSATRGNGLGGLGRLTRPAVTSAPRPLRYAAGTGFRRAGCVLHTARSPPSRFRATHSTATIQKSQRFGGAPLIQGNPPPNLGDFQIVERSTLARRPLDACPPLPLDMTKGGLRCLGAP